VFVRPEPIAALVFDKVDLRFFVVASDSAVSQLARQNGGDHQIGWIRFVPPLLINKSLNQVGNRRLFITANVTVNACLAKNWPSDSVVQKSKGEFP